MTMKRMHPDRYPSRHSGQPTKRAGLRAVRVDDVWPEPPDLGGDRSERSNIIEGSRNPPQRLDALEWQSCSPQIDEVRLVGTNSADQQERFKPARVKAGRNH